MGFTVDTDHSRSAPPRATAVFAVACVGLFMSAVVFAPAGCQSAGTSNTASNANSERPAGDGAMSPNRDMENGAMTITLNSTAFANQQTIPQQFTGDGDDVSPTLGWSGAPAGAKELALIVDDPDAPSPQPWVHWIIYKIPVTATGLPENVAKSERPAQPAGALQGQNSWGRVGYGGPAPPRGHGVHRYFFKLYALDAAIDVQPGLTKTDLLAAMEGHVLAQGELVGTYERR